MEEKENYYILKLSYPMNGNDKYIYVPQTWVFGEVEDLAVIRYPRGPLPELLQRMEAGSYENTCTKDWAMLATEVVQRHKSYGFATNYTKRLNKLNQSKRCDNMDNVNKLLTSDSDTSKFTLADRSNFENKNDRYFEAVQTRQFQHTDDIIRNKRKNIKQSSALKISDSTDEVSESSKSLTSSGQLSNDEILTTSRTRSTRYSKHIHYAEDSSDDDFEKQVTYKRIIRHTNANDYNYRRKVTNKPLKLTLIRKPNESGTEQQLTANNADKGGFQSQTSPLAPFETSFQELRKHLTDDTHEFSHRSNTQYDLNTHTQGNSDEKSYDCIECNVIDKQKTKLTTQNDTIENTRESFLSNELTNISQDHCDSKESQSNIDSDMISDIAPIIEITEMDIDHQNNNEIEKEIENQKTVIKKTEDNNKKLHSKRKNGGHKYLESEIKDTKWTLEHPEKNVGLVELEEGSGIYVDEAKLQTLKTLSKGINQYAQLLLLEVFNINALAECTWSGDPAKSKSGLDKKGTRALMTAVEKHARDRGWANLNTLYEIEEFRKQITRCLRNKMLYVRKKVH